MLWSLVGCVVGPVEIWRFLRSCDFCRYFSFFPPHATWWTREMFLAQVETRPLKWGGTLLGGSLLRPPMNLHLHPVFIFIIWFWSSLVACYLLAICYRSLLLRSDLLLAISYDCYLLSSLKYNNILFQQEAVVQASNKTQDECRMRMHHNQQQQQQ